MESPSLQRKGIFPLPCFSSSLPSISPPLLAFAYFSFPFLRPASSYQGYRAALEICDQRTHQKSLNNPKQKTNAVSTCILFFMSVKQEPCLLIFKGDLFLHPILPSFSLNVHSNIECSIFNCSKQYLPHFSTIVSYCMLCHLMSHTQKTRTFLVHCLDKGCELRLIKSIPYSALFTQVEN